MKIVITGGCGFVGTNLMKWFGENEPETEVVLLAPHPPHAEMPPNHRFVFGDVRDLSNLIKAFKDADEVYHLAGVLGTSELMGVSSLAMSTNILGFNNVVDAARFCGVKRMYNVAKGKFLNDHENAYTLSKHSAELLGQMYRESFGMSIATVTWGNVIGPYQHLYPIRKLFPLMALYALEGLDIEVYGQGKQLIDCLDVRDLCTGTVYATRNLGNIDYVPYLGSPKFIHVNTYVNEMFSVMEEMGLPSKSKVVHLPMRDGEPEIVEEERDNPHNAYWAERGLAPKYTLRDSIRSVVEYVAALPEYHRRNALKFYGK